MRYGLELHARGRTIVECEAFDRVSKTSVIKKGALMQVARGRIVVSIPTANVSRHTFLARDAGDGFAYEGSFHAPRGWRIRLDQIPALTEVKS